MKLRALSVAAALALGTLSAPALLPSAWAQAAPAAAAAITPAAVVSQYATLVHANYQDVHQAALALQTAVDAFLVAPSASTQDAAKKAWLAAREAYGQTEAFRFYVGPIDNDNGPEGRMNAWPMDESFVDSVIPEADVLANAQAQAAQPGPIKGQVNRVWDAPSQQTVLGRFGWKANTGSIAHQSAGAFRGDIGITSPWAAQEACTPAQPDCLAASHGGHGDAFEIDRKTLEDVVFYQAVLAPVARRKPADPQVLRGQALFAQAQCASCHRPSYTTAEPALAKLLPRVSSPVLVGQTIWPYTDLLLHDMGPALADGRPDFAANGNQWKTPPLWGVGLIKQVNGHQRLLHDGRANGVLEAVLWHGGEAEAAKNSVRKLSKRDRAALVTFVELL
jgi:CxxC motif-containing protein (DUF1111 family)